MKQLRENDMTTSNWKRSIARGCASGLLGAVVALSGTAWGGTQCYDFNGPAVGTTYHVGRTVNAKHATIHMEKFRTTNGPSQSKVQAGEIVNSDLPRGGGAPSLKLTSIVAHVVPKKKVKKVTMKYAENLGQNGRHNLNFGVNGQNRVWNGALGQLDGKVMGDRDHGGKVKISVSAVPDGNGSYWVRGALTLQAIGGPLSGQGIQGFRFGAASQGLFDRICLEQ